MKSIYQFLRGITVLLILSLAPVVIPQCSGDKDPSRFTKAKLAVAKRVLEQMETRAATCNSQPKDKRDLCEKWAEAGNSAAKDVQAVAFAAIDKLAEAAH